MTIHQQAHNLIDTLPEDSVSAVVSVMIHMATSNMESSENSFYANNQTSTSIRKKQALNRVLEIRKSLSHPDNSDLASARDDAMRAKYGSFM
ncbi:MAG: hypothetical protein IKQ97_04495 [Eubacterium sp.]|nr:hypothetical protein [Eubacterium sp.]